jgi:hypothetical protein
LAQAAANLESVASLEFRQSVTATGTGVRQVSVTECQIAVREGAFCAVSIDQSFGTQSSTQAFDTLMLVTPMTSTTSGSVNAGASVETEPVNSWVRLAGGEWQQAAGIGAVLTGMPAGDFRAAAVERFALDATVEEQTTLTGEPVYRVTYAIDPASYADSAGSGFTANFSEQLDGLRGSGTAYVTVDGSALRRQEAELVLPVQGTEMQLSVQIDYRWDVPVEFPAVE